MATIRERGRGVWEVRAFTGRDDKGRPTQTSKTVRGSKGEAIRSAVCGSPVSPSPTSSGGTIGCDGPGSAVLRQAGQAAAWSGTTRKLARLLRTVVPQGEVMAKDLARLIAAKDESHYGLTLVDRANARRLVGYARRLVDLAREASLGEHDSGVGPTGADVRDP